MLRRLNYTDRLRIKRSDIRITLQSGSGPLQFNAELVALKEYGLPVQSLIFIEAYRQTNWMRFSFGRVGAIEPPADRRLVQFEGPEGILFRVKVTPEGDTHKLLAEADGIPLQLPDVDETNRQPLLPVRPAPLDHDVFQVDFTGDSPILLINKSLGSYSDICLSDHFMALVYPAVFREIVTRVVIVEKFDDDTMPDDWRSLWLRFAGMLPGVGDIPAADESSDKKFEWIDRATTCFSRKIGAREKFLQSWGDGK